MNSLNTPEGIQFDLFIPAIYNSYSGSTYSGLNITFYYWENSSKNQTKELTYQISGNQILEWDKSAPIFTWDSMYLTKISPKILFAELEYLDPDFDYTLIENVSVLGFDNPIHPFLSFEDKTNWLQVLGCTDISLFDIINDASVDKDDYDILGSPRPYSFTSRFSDGILADHSILIPYTITINPIDVSLSASWTAGTDLYFADSIEISDISLDVEGWQTTLPLDYLQLTAYSISEGKRVIIGAPDQIGVPSEINFRILADVGSYSDLHLEYSGNALFNPTLYNFAKSVQIIKKSVALDINFGPYATEFKIAYNFFNVFAVQLFDEDQINVAYEDQYEQTHAVYFYHYENTSDTWVFDHIKSLNSTSLVFGIYQDCTFYPITYSNLTTGLTMFNITSGMDGILPVIPGQYLGGIQYLGNKVYNSKIEPIIINIEPLEVEIRPANSDPDQTKIFNDDGLLYGTDFTYSDSRTFDFQIIDTFDETPMRQVPVWFEVGMVPKFIFNDQIEPDFSDCYGDYLLLQNLNAPTSLVYHHYRFDDNSAPILYPYYDISTGKLKAMSPFYYQMGISDNSGAISFDVDGEVLKNIVNDYYCSLGYVGLSIEDFSVYYRVYYSNSFDVEAMKIPESSYIGTPLSTEFFGNDQWVYSYQNDTLDFDSPYFMNNHYFDPFHSATHSEGLAPIHKEDTVLVAEKQTITGSNPFSLIAHITEADSSETKDGEDTTSSPELTTDHNFIERFGLSYPGHSEQLPLQMLITNDVTGVEVVSQHNVYGQMQDLD